MRARRFLRSGALLVAFAVSAGGQDLATLAHAYSANPSLANRASLIRFASAHHDESGALALLATGAGDADSRKRPDTLPNLLAARERLAKVADYVDWLTASVTFVNRDFNATTKLGESILQYQPKSPLAGMAALLAARAYSGADDPARAIDVLHRAYADLPQPDGDAALAGAYDAVRDTANAVAYDQKVWLEYPASPQAQGAEAELKRYQAELGSSYPQPSSSALLARATKLIEARDYERAARELTALSVSASGPDRDLALVRISEAGGRPRKDAEWLAYLESLQVTAPEADAERLYQVIAFARRLNRLDAMDDAIGQLTRRYPKSDWRLRALVAAGNEYLLLNQARNYEPIFSACHDGFPKSPQASYCHWKVAFSAYLQGGKDSAELLKSHLRAYPDSEKATAALYFLARLAERGSEWSDARSYYDEILAAFPNYYYAVLARQRRSQPEVAQAAPSRTVAEFLRLINFPGRPLTRTFEPLPASLPRFERARMLRQAALEDFAEMELRFGARTSEQPEAFGLELARIASSRAAPDRAIRYLKRYAPGYLHSPIESVPREFWALAFPLPWREPLVQYSRQAGLDPYAVAALIRQESEFDPHAISPANAYGLTQILPSTGRELSRRMRVRGFNSKLLLRPEFNLKLGTQYLKTLLAQFDGRWEPTLASYNAGTSRVAEWLKRESYREPAEFVESIPFSETRNYVQAVLRNADLYRRLYQN